MKLESYVGAGGLRFERNLKAFDKVVSFYLDAPERLKTTGRKVVAKGPLSPVEVIYAADALAYDIITHEVVLQSILNRRTNLSHQAIEAGISPEFSSWNLTMLGAELTEGDVTPIDIYSTACGGFDDQLTKSFQVMSQSKAKPLYFWEIPRYDPETEGSAITYLEDELTQLFTWMGGQTGHKVTLDSLQRSINLGNLLRSDMIELNAYLAMSMVPIAALEYYLVQMVLGDYAQDPETLHIFFRELLSELKLRTEQILQTAGMSSSPVRVYLMGNETQELQLFNAIEDHGGVLVGCDFRLPLYYDLMDENAKPLSALAHWIWRMPNNLPTVARIKAELGLIKTQKPDVIIISSVFGSRYLPGAERLVRDLIKEELGLPVLSIETGIPYANIEKVDYQIQAFLETMN